MSRKRKTWLIGIGVVLAASAGAGYVTLVSMSRRFEPYIREQAVQYLQKRFDSDVEMAALRVRLPRVSPVKLVLRKGRGGIARVEGAGIVLRQRGRTDAPPLLRVQRFSFEVDLGTLFDEQKTVSRVALHGVEVNIPPPGQRPKMNAGAPSPPPDSTAQAEQARKATILKEVLLENSSLVILPRDPSKTPMRFELHRVKLESAGVGVAMKYDAELTNAKPPGRIHSRGSFGPWAAGEPGNTPLAGSYTFDKADLGVFAGIAGILHSTGSFEGTLDQISARGEASVPDFRLKSAGNRVPLFTRFEVLVDGTNGNTVLKPVSATLGSTRFTTSGGIIRHEEDTRRTIQLSVSMPDGQLGDLLRLAVKGAPFMKGRIEMNTKVAIPPLSGKVREKLILDGNFEVSDGTFLRSTIQDQIDNLSRRGQGKPGNNEIDEVVSNMAGNFRLEDEVLTFRSLSFGVPGAWVDLAGNYQLDNDLLDLRGSLRLKAKVSQTQAGWKRWALKPVDPIFSKNGAGTFVKIKVDGTSRKPHFGLDRGRNQNETATADRAAPPPVSK
jgi:hypothetical protein